VVVTGRPVAGSAEQDGAFARRGRNACSWVVGSPGISKTFQFAAGSYTMTSFRNTLVNPAREYVTPAAPSAEFRFGWDGTTLTGASGGWTCASGKVTRVDAGGEPALELDVTLSRPTVQVAVTQHYVIYPDVALIREWTDYANTDTSAHQLTQPSFLEQRVMGDVLADTDLLSMGGAQTYDLRTTPLTAGYSDTVASHASWNNMPWFGLWDRKTKDGMYAGFDYFDNWSALVGVQDGTGTSLSLNISDYDSPLAPGASVTSPKAFDGVYKNDLDDMTNRLLDWQYGYMWDYTRAPYFTAVRDEGDWGAGSSYFNNYDQPTGVQKVFDLADQLRSMGVDTYHRDNGWWNNQGDWAGADWRITHDYLTRSGMSQIIYMPIYFAGSDSQIYQSHPEYFQGGILDMGQPAARQWAINTLVTDARNWGDYEWRPDFEFQPGLGGAFGLAQDQGYRAVIQGFLDARPGSGFHAVNAGGADYGYDYLRFADGGSFSDAGGLDQIDGASRIFPIDKLSGVPEYVSRTDSCNAKWTAQQMMWNPDMFGDVIDPALNDCVRQMTGLYHYLATQRVVGRWVQQYHPHASDGVDSNWLQRLSGDNKRALVIYKGDDSAATVTVYPKGLKPDQVYDVRFQLQAGASQRTGADLMTNGITFAAITAGEMVWLNMPDHPGSGTDHTPPTAPKTVTATVGTNIGYPGVEVSWTPGTDNNWVSSYQVLRNGTVLGDVAKGTFYFDHTPAASPAATYAVRTVDGDGNLSPLTASIGGSRDTAFADDASPEVVYTGQAMPGSGLTGPYSGTQTDILGYPCHTACQGFSGTQGQNGWSYQIGAPAPPCHAACQAFSDVQGTGGWSYQTSIAGQWSDIVNYRQFGFLGDCCSWFDISQTSSGGQDFSGLISPHFILPGVGHDTARAWTAPKDGVVDISAQAIPQGTYPVVLTVTKNGQPVWGPQTLDGSGSPVDTSVPDVAVAAGDVIRFEVQGASDITFDALLRWDPDITYQGDPPPPPPPPFGDMATYHADGDFSGDGAFWDADLASVSARLLQPSTDRDVARAWTAPRDGVVDIAGHASSTDNATVSITLNGQPVWGPQTAGEVDTNVPGLAVSAGDVIRFQVAAQPGSGRPLVRWDPDISYQGDPPPVVQWPSASWTFTGSQVIWYAQLGRDKGIAQVLIDGKPDAQINLFAPDVNDWSTPVYVKTFPVPGEHTITVRGTGNADAHASGTTVDVDGFQAVTTTPAVTQDTSPAVAYRGHGWQDRAEPAASGGTLAASAQAGDSVSVSFTGTGVTWVGRICPACGEADVYLDGAYVTRIDTFGYRGPQVWQAAVFQHSWTRQGRHTLKIVVDGSQNLGASSAEVDIDSFQVTGAR
jgi:hypothetical protein